MSRRLLCALVMCGVAAGAFAQSQAPQPFSATYDTEWRGISAGTSRFELVHIGGNEYTYRSLNLARGLFRLAFPDAITQMSRFIIVDDAVIPMSYRADDGSSKTDRDVSLDFNWQNSRVTGVAENKPVSVPLEPGTQDALSVQIALMIELAAGRSPKHFLLLDKDELKDYQYTREGTTTLATALGKIETVIYRSMRVGPGSTRVTRMWLAPSLGFLPLRAEQLRNGRREFALAIRTVTHR